MTDLVGTGALETGQFYYSHLFLGLQHHNQRQTKGGRVQARNGVSHEDTDHKVRTPARPARPKVDSTACPSKGGVSEHSGPARSSIRRAYAPRSHLQRGGPAWLVPLSLLLLPSSSNVRGHFWAAGRMRWLVMVLVRVFDTWVSAYGFTWLPSRPQLLGLTADRMIERPQIAAHWPPCCPLGCSADPQKWRREQLLYRNSLQ